MTSGATGGPEMFRLDIAEKDVSLALASARELGVPLPLAEAAAAGYRRAVEEGHGDEVFFAALRSLERDAGVEVERIG